MAKKKLPTFLLENNFSTIIEKCNCIKKREQKQQKKPVCVYTLYTKAERINILLRRFFRPFFPWKARQEDKNHPSQSQRLLARLAT
jgi:hypothetical protein